MGFVCRIKTTGKVHIPVRAQKEAELKFLHQIVNQVEKYQILSSLIINFGQTPSKYLQVSLMTMAKCGETNVPIASTNDKRSITATFSITFDNKFLPMQLTYNGETNQSLPEVDFPDGFSLSTNKTHYSNEEEALSLLTKSYYHTSRKSRQSLDAKIKRLCSSSTFFGVKQPIKSLKF